jgi:predicted metal-dependent HD superfamily phosphohydrolase
MSDFDRLAQIWQSYWIDRSSRHSEINRVFELLFAAYAQPNRHYHNLNHIDQLLTTIARFNHQLKDPITVNLAVWFHDFVYDSQASDNEAQSAKAAQELLTSIGESATTIDRVQQLILSTQGHQIDANDLDQSIFLDADLAILGADPVRYQAYQQAIRREYNWVSSTDYQTGRIQVLESLLKRDRLYCTDLLFAELESIARSNIKQEISELISAK